MTPTVRAVGKEDLEGYLRNLSTAFLGSRQVTAESLEWLTRRIDFERTLAAFDGAEPCGGARSFPVSLAVPGGTLPAGAVTSVHMLPTHRRRGNLQALMRRQLSDLAEREEPLAILIASEWPIYGRFGYGPATEQAAYELNATTAAFRTAPTGRVSLVEPSELRAVAPDVYNRSARPGWISRDPLWWDALTDLDPMPSRTPPAERMRAVWRDDSGTVRGYVVYDPTDGWSLSRPEGSLSVRELVAADPEAYRELWRFLCDVDLVTRIEAPVRPVDEALPHLLADGRTVRQVGRSDHLWVRLVDPARALAGRRYASGDALVLDVADPFLGRGGRWHLEGTPAGAECRPSAQDPDLVLDVSALGAAYLGGTSFASLAGAGLVAGSPGAVARADAMFRVTPAPHLTTSF